MSFIRTICPVCKVSYLTSDQVTKFQWFCSTECENSEDLKDDDKTDPQILNLSAHIGKF